MNSVCVFCRQNTYHQNVCIACIEGFRDWILKSFEFSHFKIDEIKNIILFGIAEILRVMCNRNYSLKQIKRYSRVRGWSGFYCSGGVYFIPDLKIIVEDEHVSIHNICQIISKKLRDNGIFIYEEVHMQSS